MLSLPKYKRVKGLFIYCNSCKGLFSDEVKLIQNCKCYIEKNTLSYYVRFKVSQNKFVSKKLETKVLESAINECIGYSNQRRIVEKIGRNKLILSIEEGMRFYIDYLNNVNVPLYQIKKRTTAHIKEVERHFKYVKEALVSEGYNPKLLHINNIGTEHVNSIYVYATEIKKFKNRTFNKFISTLRVFIEFIKRKHIQEIQNPFKDVVSRPVKQNIDIISLREFNLFLEAIKQENGIMHFSNGLKRNVYKNWLGAYFKLALYTGRRREELVMLKFSDIVYDEQNVPVFIKSEHFKVNRLKNLMNEESKDYVLIPITKEVYELLIALNYHELKGSNHFLIAPNEQMNRKSMMFLASKAFSHFFKLSNQNKELQFKCLRKTYITQLFLKYGENARYITHHSSMDVIKNHYLDQRPLLNSIVEFRVFENTIEKDR